MVVPYYADASFTPVWNVTGKQLAVMHRIAPFRFTNQYGKEVTGETFKGNIYLASFFFTSCPSICPKLTNTMKMVYDQFKGRPGILFLSHSVTPEIDDVPKLREFAERNRVLSPQWQFVTGDKDSIYAMARKSYFIEGEMGLSKLTGQFLHTENFVLVDENGHIRGLYNGTLEAEVPRIVEDIKMLYPAK